MCGLFGAHSTTLSQNELSNVKLLAHLSGIRGMDSTGVVIASRFKKAPRVWMEKDVIDPCNFFDERPDIFKGGVSTVVGHCRAATVGSVTTKNAHPYHFGKLLGVHNGTIPSLTPKDVDRTDSSVLYEKMNIKGIVPTLQEARHGAYALAWIDVKENTLNFIRNDQRPLWFVRSKANTWYWASERRMLEFMINHPDGYEQPFLLKPNTLVRFPLDSTTSVAIQDYVPAPPPPVTTSVPNTKWCKECFRSEHFCQCKDKKKGDNQNVVVPFLPDPKKMSQQRTPRTMSDTTGGKSSSAGSAKRLITYLYEHEDWTLCDQCHQEEQHCQCPGTFDKSTLPQVVDYTQYANALSRATKEIQEGPSKDLYVGFNGKTITIEAAKKALECGCGWCAKVKEPDDRVVWTEPNVYWCNSAQCQDAMAHMYPAMHPKFPSEIVEV